MSTDRSIEAVQTLLLSLADDELVLGHRDSEWTGHAPILEEDIAFSNIAQDELGHSLVWFGLFEKLSGHSPDVMAFERQWNDFTCCHFVEYPRGDFAYTLMRQYLFDEAEFVRLSAFAESSYSPLKEAAGKIIREESYHLLHSGGLVERLGTGTDESHERMQKALDIAYPQALGMFEPLVEERMLVSDGVMPEQRNLFDSWGGRIRSHIASATLHIPPLNGAELSGSYGGRRRNHTEHLKLLVEDLQSVYRIAPGGKW